VSFFEGIQTDVQGWISDVGPVRLGLILAVLITGALTMAYVLRRPAPSPTTPDRRDVSVS
jgi:hypothetical protein